MSDTFRRWLKNLRDKRARARIVVRIERVVEGNFGDHRSVGGGVGELRIDVGAGYRIYYTIRDNAVVILLCGGDKSRQQNDIERARRMAGEL
ncbi:MAG: type II toxin-antitoxin system RelE/ParE family toxin [Gemmatimonadales bacterium]|uniref:type II toxin-antitoxin system RelE/ParE family toxin n=1 Tax=Candidatus Palauibacter irciniicola TaxID=3056733 RepID=UPI00137DC359|nr:type II toxin-antitoxin system RelE/ParE family toxin [Candidatus Palauibacter irciniicola]